MLFYSEMRFKEKDHFCFILQTSRALRFRENMTKKKKLCKAKITSQGENPKNVSKNEF